MITPKINQPIRPTGKTKAKIEFDGNIEEVDFGFPFSAGEVLFQEGKVCLFQDGSCKEKPLLGKIFDLKGNWICDISFPKSPYPNHVNFSFHWCGYEHGNIHVSFSTDSVSHQDFGAIFDIKAQQFKEPHAVR